MDNPYIEPQYVDAAEAPQLTIAKLGTELRLMVDMPAGKAMAFPATSKANLYNAARAINAWEHRRVFTLRSDGESLWVTHHPRKA